MRARVLSVILLAALAGPPELPAASADTLPPPRTPHLPPLDEQIRAGEEGEDGVDRDEGEDDRDGTGGRARSPAWSLRAAVRAFSPLRAADGYADGRYAGSPVGLRHTVEVRRGRTLRAGILLDKDPGEMRVADFLSWSVSAEALSGGLRVVAGDFRFRAGHGLLFGPSRGYAKGAVAVDPAIRPGGGLSPGVSADERHFFRGAGTEFREGGFRAALFGSGRALAPRLTAEGVLTGFDESGYHRTTSELTRRGRVVESSFGASIRHGGVVTAGVSFEIGAQVLAAGRSWSEAADCDTLPPPPSTRRGSVDLRLTAGPVRLFGEAAAGLGADDRYGAERGHAGGRAPGWIVGVLFSPEQGSRALIVGRRCPDLPAYERTRAFGETGSDESGVYLALERALPAGAEISAFVDLWSRISPASDGGFPPAGTDRLVALAWTPARGVRLELRVRSRREGGEGGAGGRDGLRVGVDWGPGRDLSCRTRLEGVAVVGEGTPGPRRGIDLSHSMAFSPAPGLGVRVSMHLFSAGTGDAAIRVAESDLPGSILLAALAGRGIRIAVTGSWEPSPLLRLTAAVSMTRRDDVRSLGSGAGRTPSNASGRAGIQADLSL